MREGVWSSLVVALPTLAALCMATLPKGQKGRSAVIDVRPRAGGEYLKYPPGAALKLTP
jgi:hypothetical protein